MEIKSINDVEKLETVEGIMTPLIFGENLCLFHLEIPPNFNIPPHGHPGEGILYCLEGELEVISKDKKAIINNGTALLVKSDEKVGINNLSNKIVKVILISSSPPIKSI